MGSTGTIRRIGTTTSSSSGPTATTGPVVAPVNAGNPAVQNQTPTVQNTPVVSNALANLVAMDDTQMSAVVNASKNADMPNFLKDVKDPTQAFAFQMGLNEMPQVLDVTEFAQFMRDNNIPQNEVISRTVGGASYTNYDGTRVNLSPTDVNDITKYSRLNYIGGKHGGTSYGSGTYFDMNGGGSTGYGSGSNKATMEGVLNPAKAKVISWYQLQRDVANFRVSHPKTASAIGSFNSKNASIYALCMGYNVITSGSKSNAHQRGEYYTVIDRSALVLRK